MPGTPAKPPDDEIIGYDLPPERSSAPSSERRTPERLTSFVAERGAAFVAGSASVAPLSSTRDGTASAQPVSTSKVALLVTVQPVPLVEAEENPTTTDPALIAVAPECFGSRVKRRVPFPFLTMPRPLLCSPLPTSTILAEISKVFFGETSIDTSLSRIAMYPLAFVALTSESSVTEMESP